jgi:hypothetical protein
MDTPLEEMGNSECGISVRLALIAIPANALSAPPRLRTADATDRGLAVGSAVRTEIAVGRYDDQCRAPAAQYCEKVVAQRLHNSAFRIPR